MSTPMSRTIPASTFQRVPLRLWELLLAWLVLAAMAVNALSVAYLVASNWTVVVEGIGVGALRVWVFFMPLLGLVAGVLLVRRSKWALAIFFVHLVASLAYTAYFQGLASVPWFFWLGYIAEVGILSFCLHLLGKGALA